MNTATIDATDVGQRAAAAWLEPAPVPDETVAERVAAAGAAYLDQVAPGWALRCDPALAPHNLAERCVEQAPELDETELIGAWMHEIAQRLAQS